MTALGTVGASFAAVYFGGIQPRRQRPSLSLHFDPDNPFDRQLAGARVVVPGGPFGPEKDQAWLRLRVRNEPRRVAAEDVQVHVTDVRELAARPGTPPTDPRSPGGLPLVWANTGGVTSGLVPPGADEPIDFGYVDRSDADSGEAAFVLVVNPLPMDNRQRLTSLRAELGLTVTARNADPNHYRLVVFCDGKWGDDPWEHLAIESLSRVRVRR